MQNLLWLVEDHSLKPSPGKSVRLSRNSKCSKKHWGVTSSGRALARVQPPVLPKKKNQKQDNLIAMQSRAV
jgi:hypothetical protein